MGFTDPLDIRYGDDGREFTLITAFSYTHPQVGRIVVPAGFPTDFASIPRVFWRILPPHGRYGKAAVVHDYLYRTSCHPCDRRVADAVFLDAMGDLGVPWLIRRIMWAAVRCFGCFAFVPRVSASVDSEGPGAGPSSPRGRDVTLGVDLPES